ncbi:MAG: hypothetical protein AAFN93_25750 [Bacteroidota bacterium]
MTYFIRLPFLNDNVINEGEARDKDVYFRQSYSDLPFSSRVIERFFKNELITVIYCGVTSVDNQLIRFHNEKYSAAMSYQIETHLADRTYQYTTFLDNEKKGSFSYHFNERWDIVKEHSYDANYNLVEYREFICNSAGEVKRERVFFASSWVVNEETYD